ncbi:MAG: LacI family transcriptional regulator [Actinobacteria bacterium]|nr:LacI family transcriptional regulator [Actinomycetota bacterium]
MEKNINIKSIADRLGVSTASVSNALNDKGRIGEDLKKRIIETATELNYKQNIIAKTLKIKKSWIIGVLIPEMLFEYFFQIIIGMEEIATEKDYTLVFANTHYDSEKEIKDINKFLRMLIDGLIIIGGSGEINHISKFIDNTPTVLIARHLNNDNISYPSVFYDDRAAQINAVSYLNNLGHKNIGYVGIMPAENIQITNIELRKRGYMDGLKINNLKFNSQNLFFKSSHEYVSNLDNVYDFLKNNLFIENFQQMPTAILCQNDYIAIALIKILMEKGIRVPNDVSVMGFDNLVISNYTNPALTTTKQPKKELGVVGINLLLDIIENKSVNRKKILLPTNIIERASTAKV